MPRKRPGATPGTCWCGQPARPWRTTCGADHPIRRRARLDCRCGKPTLPGRYTCSDECSRAAQGIKNPEKWEDRACVTCGGTFHVYKNSNTKTCSTACADAYRVARRKPNPPCTICSKPVMRRSDKTCSPECGAASKERYSEARRRVGKQPARRKHGKSGYKGKDKAEILARLVLEQNGSCAICGSTGTSRGDGTSGLVLDHCHTTGLPRTALCGPCNAALGLVREDPRIASRLAEYASLCLTLRNQGT